MPGQEGVRAQEWEGRRAQGQEGRRAQGWEVQGQEATSPFAHLFALVPSHQTLSLSVS